VRLFFGFSLPDPIRQAVSDRAAACQSAIAGRYVLKENYHITLAFLGDVPEARIGDAQDVLRRSIGLLPSPRLTLGKTDFFGRAQNAILIVRADSSPALDPLHSDLVRRLEAAALPFDAGPFSPHITIARHACIGDSPLPSGDCLSFVPDCAHLYLSARNEQNLLTYTPIASVPFAKSCSGSGKYF